MSDVSRNSIPREAPLLAWFGLEVASPKQRGSGGHPQPFIESSSS